MVFLGPTREPNIHLHQIGFLFRRDEKIDAEVHTKGHSAWSIAQRVIMRDSKQTP